MVMRNSNLLYVILAMVAMSTGCSRKAVPTISVPVSVNNSCDSIIQALIDSIRTASPVQSDFDDMFIDVPIVEVEQVVIDTSNVCNYYKITALEIAQQLNGTIQKLKSSEKEAEYYKALASSRAKKIVNNYTVNSKNKNTQIGDDNVQQIKPKGPAVSGEGNVTAVKPKQSAIGDGNKLDNRSGDRLWLGVLLAFGTLFILKNVLNLIKMYFPVSAPIISMIQKFLPI